MGDGLSRRDLIKGAAVAGAVAWTAPTLIVSPASAQTAVTCGGVKITPGGAINGGTVAQCNSFTTDSKLDLSCFVTDVSGTYNVHDGLVYQICGPTATSLSGVAAKTSGNGSCTTPFDQAGCDQLLAGTPGDGAVFAGNQSFTHSAINCTDPASAGFLIRIGPIAGSVTANDGTVVGPAPAGCRFVVIDSAPNVNNIGLAFCFPAGSPPPSC